MFNAVRYIKELESSGFSREQAEATLNTLYGFTKHSLATKSDIQDFRADMHEFKGSIRADLQEFRHELKALEYRMTIKFGVMLTVAISLLVTLQKLIP